MFRIQSHIGFVALVDRLFRKTAIPPHMLFSRNLLSQNELKLALEELRVLVKIQFKLSEPQVSQLATLVLEYMCSPARVARRQAEVLHFLGLKQIFQKVFVSTNLEVLAHHLGTAYYDQGKKASTEKTGCPWSGWKKAASVEFKMIVGLLHLIEKVCSDVKKHFEKEDPNSAYFDGKANPDFMLDQLGHVRAKLLSCTRNARFNTVF